MGMWWDNLVLGNDGYADNVKQCKIWKTKKDTNANVCPLIHAK